jgi:hypothetical protein
VNDHFAFRPAIHYASIAILFTAIVAYDGSEIELSQNVEHVVSIVPSVEVHSDNPSLGPYLISSHASHQALEYPVPRSS